MKRGIRKAAALLLAVALVVPCVEMIVRAADYNHKLSVDTKVNANPGKSNFSMEYFDTSDYSFKKMDKFVEAGGSSYWTIEGDTSVVIKGWAQSASSSKYAVVRYTATDTGAVTVQKESDVRTGAFTGSAGDFLVVQKSAEGYSPIWPEKGNWKWESVAKDGATSFANTGLKTYVKAGDELLFIARSSSKAVANININYWVSMTKSASDTDSLRPAAWDSYFKGADDKLATAGPWLSSPYVSKDTNADTKVYTQEYISGMEGFQKLDTYNAGSPAYWSLGSDANLRIGPYYMMATANKYSATVYHATADGYANLTNKYQLFTSKNAAYDDAEAMVVLSNNQEYYPVWPVKGSWEWKRIPKGSATEGVELDLTAYMKAGDELALVVRSSNTEKGITWMQTDCSTHFSAISNDYRELYPSVEEWSSVFEGYSFRMPLGSWTEQKESWHIAKESSDVFTAEYNAGNGFVQMENYISDAKPAYWQSGNNKVIVKPYMQNGTADTYSAAVFHMPVTGYLKIENAYKPIYTHYIHTGAYEPAEAILVQKSTDASGKEMWSPIWPNRGEWKYQVIPMRTSAEDTAGLELSANTYAKAGDAIYFVVRSGCKSTGFTAVQSELDVFYMESAADEGSLYPTVWSESFPYGDNLSQADKFTGMTLSLDGKISFNFYVDRNNTLSDDAYVEFVLPKGGTQVVTKANAIETGNGLKFTCLVPAKEMADVIAVTLYDGGKVLDAKAVSVRDYAEIIIKNETNNEAYANAMPLIKSMLHYGAYAQKLFEYNTGDLANKNYVSEDAVQSIESAQLAGFAKEKQGKEGFGSLAGATLILEGETTLRMFFAFEGGVDPEGLKFIVNGIEQVYKKSGNYYIVEFANIAANDLDKDFTVTVLAGSNSFDASCSVMTYCYNALVNTNNVDLQNLAKAMYLYNASANDYFR